MADPGEKQPWRKRWKRWRNRVLVWIAKHTLPFVYLAYMRLVWWTSRVLDQTDIGWEELKKPPHKIVVVLWHQDVVCVPWIYRSFKPHTIASVGDAGEIITHILKRCNFTVLRGGSSKGKKRHTEILPQLVAHMQASQGACGITVDGSFGPPYRLKRGAIVVAQECRCAIFTTRIWCKRKILLPTWDKTMVPLPFNTIAVLAQGPYYPPADLDTPEAFEQFRKSVENHLLDSTYQSFQMLEKKIPNDLMSRFPDDWRPPTTEPPASSQNG
jgi:lysophospholipid acyltransferase (LPLAT)-like uncharacterized protein